jgi:hypothetical protein
LPPDNACKHAHDDYQTRLETWQHSIGQSIIRPHVSAVSIHVIRCTNGPPHSRPVFRPRQRRTALAKEAEPLCAQKF